MKFLTKKKKKPKWDKKLSITPFIKRDAGDIEKGIQFFNNANNTGNLTSANNNGGGDGAGMGMGETLTRVKDAKQYIKDNCSNCYFYTLENGDQPVVSFIDEQNPLMKAKICSNLIKLNHLGRNARRPLSAPLGDGIFELISEFGGDETRCLYFFKSGNKMIFTNGFIKKTQKTPRDQILLAKKRKKDYESREETK